MSPQFQYFSLVVESYFSRVPHIIILFSSPFLYKKKKEKITSQRWKACNVSLSFSYLFLFDFVFPFISGCSLRCSLRVLQEAKKRTNERWLSYESRILFLVFDYLGLHATWTHSFPKNANEFNRMQLLAYYPSHCSDFINLC